MINTEYYQSKEKPNYLLKIRGSVMNHYNTAGATGVSVFKDKTRITEYMKNRFKEIFESDFNHLIK